MGIFSKSMRRRIEIIIIIFAIVVGVVYGCGNASANTRPVDITVQKQLELTTEAKANVLMEASTGKIIYEKNPKERLSPASITKIMTLLIAFDSLSEGRIGLEDIVTTSSYAKSMGGSQVFLEEGEQQTVETLIKCIVIASGNDAAVAMAEYISGSEEAFVIRMNERAKALGLENTHFVDCCGLTSSDEHYTSAEDVAIMSRELITKYPEIYKYSSIWMESITHVTNKGTSQFMLTNTNKLLKQYEGVNGLKTGMTSKAKYCISATAKRNDIELIAVVMAAPTYKSRLEDGKKMLNYGYSICRQYIDEMNDLPQRIYIEKGVKDTIGCQYKNKFTYISTSNENLDGITKNIEFLELRAPIKKGQCIGYAIYKLDEKEIGRREIVSKDNIKEAGYGDYLKRIFSRLILK